MKAYVPPLPHTCRVQWFSILAAHGGESLGVDFVKLPCSGSIHLQKCWFPWFRAGAQASVGVKRVPRCTGQFFLLPTPVSSFFFFHSCTCKEHSTTNHLFSISESVPGEHDLKWVVYSIRMQGESPWTTSTKDKTAVVLTSSSGKSLALSSFSTLNALTHLTSSVYTLFSTLTCLISFLLQGSLFISVCCFKIFKSQF